MINRLELRRAPPGGTGSDVHVHGEAARPSALAAGIGLRGYIPYLAIVAMALLLALGGSLPANAAPVSPHITLDVRHMPSNGSDGYTDTTASNGAVYSYKYTGGDGGGGDVTFRERGRVTINVQLSGSGYRIDHVGFTGDIHEQLSLVSNPRGGSVAVIQNLNSAVQTASYKVTVVDDADEATIPCDPKIINR